MDITLSDGILSTMQAGHISVPTKETPSINTTTIPLMHPITSKLTLKKDHSVSEDIVATQVGSNSRNTTSVYTSSFLQTEFVLLNLTDKGVMPLLPQHGITRMLTYDYIIIGAGASGLMLANALGKDPYFSDKSVLLLDKSQNRTNDRTWCFWEMGKGEFDDLIYKSWDHIHVADKTYSKRIPIAPYKYKMLRATEFYKDLDNKIKKYTNISFLEGSVTALEDKGRAVLVQTNTDTYKGKQVFSSIFNYKELINQKKYPVLQQHFIGWFVKTPQPTFDKDQATFMDFSIPQKGNTRFMYVLPISETEALVEYTLFSKNPLPVSEYEAAIADYLLTKMDCHDYEIIQKESGNIPMSCFNFNTKNSKNILHIGVAGGWAKPSSGYTFKRTQQKIRELIPFLKSGLPLNNFAKKNRFWFYDLLLLDILQRDNSKGHLIFGALFKKRDPQSIFKFLDEQSSLIEDIKVIAACPKKEFILALLRRVFSF